MPENLLLSPLPDFSKREIGLLLELLPSELKKLILQNSPDLSFMELILDLDKEAELRLPTKRTLVLPYVVKLTDLENIDSQLTFNKSGRAGLPGTLHRLSKVPDLDNKTVGLTIRVGLHRRSFLPLIEDLLTGEDNILICGSPGKGKTTALREICAHLSTKKHVIVVDKTNEIGGESNPPHYSIGTSRRFQVPHGKTQGEVLLMALESHWPEVLVVDEVSTKEEAEALLSVSRRGTKIIATAHATNLENLLQNPPLSDLFGRIDSVTLGDDEATKRGVGKIHRERELFPVFDTVVQIDDFDVVSIYYNLVETIDTFLAKGLVIPEERRLLGNQMRVITQFKLGLPFSTAHLKPIQPEVWESNGNGKKAISNGKSK